MESLFDNPLGNMPGPVFLLIYAILIVSSAMVLSLFKSTFDWTSGEMIPLIPQSPDPFEIAFLRGGRNEFARTVVFTLIQKGFLQITNERKTSYIGLVPIQPNWTILPQIEKSVLGWFQTTRETSEVFETSGLVKILEPFSRVYEQQLNQENLLVPADVRVKTKLVSYLLFAVIALLGCYKMTSAIIHGRYNVLFILLLIGIAFFLFRWLSGTKRVSKLGKKYIGSLQNAFEKIKDNPAIAKQYYSQSIPALNSIDPLLLAMGVYGTGILVGNGYSHFEQAFARARKDSENGSFSSCSSSCGSTSGSGW